MCEGKGEECEHGAGATVMRRRSTEKKGKREKFQRLLKYTPVTSYLR